MSDNPRYDNPDLTAKQVIPREVDAVLQADQHDGCEHCVSAWIASWFGHPTTERDVWDWQATHGHPRVYDYPNAVHRIPMQRRPFAERFLHRDEAMGECFENLIEGRVANVRLFRVRDRAHCVALVGLHLGRKTVEIMDPLMGYTAEPWSWFKGDPGNRQAHTIQGWFGR